MIDICFIEPVRAEDASLCDFLDSSDTTRGTRLIRLLGEKQIRLGAVNHNPLRQPARAVVAAQAT